MAQYNLLRREVDTSRELYANLSSRLSEIQVSSSLVTSNISVIDRADVPLKRSGSRTALKLLIGCLVGLVSGVGLAFLLEYLDTSIRGPREVEAVLRVPALGLVPKRAPVRAHLGRRLRLHHVGLGHVGLGAGGDAPSAFALVAHQATGSGLAAAVCPPRGGRGVRAAHPPKTMLVTPLHQQDGKTSVSTNTAITLAQLGMGDVLLVDADLRHPDLHRLL